MKRRINYTDRKRIPREKISIKLIEHNNQKSLDAKFNLDGMELPEHAAVYLEAYHKTDYMRYHFGRVGQIRRPDTTDLGSLGRIENLRFRVKVVDESGTKGLVLAVADRIRPETATQIRAILPVEFRELGNQIWRVSFDDGGEPILELNSTIPFIRDKAKGDYRLFFYVYPPVIREILNHMLLVKGISDSDDPEDWEKDWLEFARFCAGYQPDILCEHQDGFDEDEVKEWVEKVVTEFCISHRDKWDNLIRLEEKGEL